VTVLEDILMLDFPLQMLIGVVAAFIGGRDGVRDA
jgi:hypothetical protein